MSKEQIIEALGSIDDTIIQKAMEFPMKKHKFVFRRWMAAAACLALLLSASLTAEANNGSVSNLLIPLFGGAQTQIVDQIGVPIGASTSVSGYTLTVDAIIGDRYSVMITYTLSRDDGQPIPGNIDFARQEIPASGYRTRIEIDPDNPSNAHFHERWLRNEPLLGRIVTVSFTDLVIGNGEEAIPVAEGTWELTFALRYPDATEKLAVKKTSITDEVGRKFQVTGIWLSPVGIHFDLRHFDPDFRNGLYEDFHVSVCLKDGTELQLEGGGGGSWTEGDKYADISYYAEFDVPIPPEDIMGIIVCGSAIPIGE